MGQDLVYEASFSICLLILLRSWLLIRTMGLQDTKNLVTGDKAHLRDTMRVTEGNTDLGGCQTLASQLADVLNDIIGGGLEP